jgi:hypothetical protein
VELTYNNNNYFFEIECPDMKVDAKINDFISEDVIQFQITEEMNKLSTGNILLRDKSGIYSKIFRPGARFNVSWGYRKWNYANIGFGELMPPISYRKGIRCVVSSPSGSGDDSGKVDLNINFFSIDFLNSKVQRIFDSGTKYSIINEVMAHMDCQGIIIEFDDQNQAINYTNSIRQHASDFNFLHNIAQEWRCTFNIGFDKTGSKTGMFIGDNRMNGDNAKNFTRLVLGYDTYSKDFYYRTRDKGNVRNYSWQQNAGESGQGDSVQLYLVGGQTQFVHYVAETQTVITYRLNEQRVKEKLANSDDKIKTALSANFLGATDFNDVKWAFDPVETKTAPQGVGYSASLSMIGDPLIIPGMHAKFIDGFPAPLTQKTPDTDIIIFWIRRATHTITKPGYFTDLEIVDSYTLNGTFLNDSGLRV